MTIGDLVRAAFIQAADEMGLEVETLTAYGSRYSYRVCCPEELWAVFKNKFQRFGGGNGQGTIVFREASEELGLSATIWVI